jgi:putative ABC transport system substrate-binding protein
MRNMLLVLIVCLYSNFAFSTGIESRILIINSDESVGKYATIHREFKSALKFKIFEINMQGKTLSSRALKQRLSKLRPDLIYTIGSKAYIQTTAVIQNQPLIFSSMINWRRFTLNNKTYGVALELQVDMPLYLYSYLFPKIRRVGVLYSQRYNQQWFNTAMLQAQEVGISLYGQAVDKPEKINGALKRLLPKVDAIWLISDPIVLYDKNSMQTIFAKAAARKKPIFAYNTLFMKYGAVLTIAADIPTMGRQAAGIAEDIINQEQVDKKVQPPAGSHVILNLKKVHEYGIKINNAALSSVEEIIQE